MTTEGSSMHATWPKCGSTEVLADIPVVTSVDRFSAVPVSSLAYTQYRPIAL
jgi:hypothetical protein